MKFMVRVILTLLTLLVCFAVFLPLIFLVTARYLLFMLTAFLYTCVSICWLFTFGYGALGIEWLRPDNIGRIIKVKPCLSFASQKTVRCVCFSDTHSHHLSLHIPDGDMLVFAGDLTRHGTIAEMRDFAAWLKALPHAHKIVIAGNHDKCLDARAVGECAAREAATELVEKGGCEYLSDSGVTVCGLRIWGVSPLERVDVPSDKVDILLSHRPPRGHCDLAFIGWRAGSHALAPFVARLRPTIHVFGHIHEGYGYMEESGITFINAAASAILHRLVHPAVVVDFEC